MAIQRLININLAVESVTPGGKDSTLPAVKAGGLVPFPGPIKFNNILGGNGLFILAVVALLLLCKDDKNLRISKRNYGK